MENKIYKASKSPEYQFQKPFYLYFDSTNDPLYNTTKKFTVLSIGPEDGHMVFEMRIR